MANIKKFIQPWSETAKTVYMITSREADSPTPFLLNDADGAFADAPADPYVAMAEHAVIKGRYERSESRTVWPDGRYTVTAYKQAGGSPSPVADTIIGAVDIYIINDLEVVADASVSTRALESTVAKEAKQNTILNRIGAFTGTGLNTVLGFFRAIGRKDADLTPSDMGGAYNNITNSLEASQAEHNATQVLINASFGDGANQIIIQAEITGGSTPIVGVSTQVFNSGETLVLARGITNVSGQTTLALNDGTYKVRLYKAGYTFTVPETIVISGNGTFILDGTVIDIGTPLSVNTCRIYEWCFMPDDTTPRATVTAKANIIDLPYSLNGKLHAGDIINGTYDPVSGKVYWDIVYGARVMFKIPEMGLEVPKVVPSVTTKRLIEIT